jgi:putative Holliday junction resolvase
MTICKIEDFMTQRNSIGKLFALDVGKKTIGIAVSDPAWKVASPVSILYRRKFTPDMEKLMQMASDHDIGGMVVGWPLNMDGSTGPRCDSVRDFIHAMMRIKDWPVLLQDERLSTVSVERAMVDADMTRQKRAERRDALAATWILQSALDVMAGLDI